MSIGKCFGQYDCCFYYCKCNSAYKNKCRVTFLSKKLSKKFHVVIRENVSMVSVVITGNYSFNQKIFTGIVCILATITVLGEYSLSKENQHIK